MVLFFLCDLSGRGVRRFFPHAEDAKDAKAGAAAPWDGRPSLLFWRFWPEIFESMNLGMPNQITSANAGKRLGFAGKSLVGLSPRPGVAEFHRSTT